MTTSSYTPGYSSERAKRTTATSHGQFPAEMPPIGGHGGPSHGGMQPMDDLFEYARSYARERPGTAALWCLGIGFILGWKLKPW